MIQNQAETSQLKYLIALPHLLVQQLVAHQRLSLPRRCALPPVELPWLAWPCECAEWTRTQCDACEASAPSSWPPHRQAPPPTAAPEQLLRAVYLLLMYCQVLQLPLPMTRRVPQCQGRLPCVPAVISTCISNMLAVSAVLSRCKTYAEVCSAGRDT